MAIYNSLDTLTKATYDISNYGEDLFLPFTTDTLALQSVTWSAVNELLQEESVALQVSAYTSGAHSVDSVTVTFSELLPDKTQLRQIATIQKNTNMTNLAATGTNVAIMHFEGNTPFKISQGNYVRIDIQFNSTDTLTATSHEGIMPYFYFQAGSLAKTMCESGLQLHIHAALDHGFVVFRDQSITNKLDFDGVNKDGFDRSHSP